MTISDPPLEPVNMSAAMWDHGLELLHDAGIPADQAPQWLQAMDAERLWVDRHDAALAADYLQRDYTFETAHPWWARGVPSQYAAQLAEAGWTPAEALELVAHIDPNPFTHMHGLWRYRRNGNRALQWAATGLPSDRVLRLVAAGIKIHELPALADTDDTTLDVLAALRQAL